MTPANIDAVQQMFILDYRVTYYNIETYMKIHAKMSLNSWVAH